jgi:CNT family concentrative nucleoside transporter
MHLRLVSLVGLLVFLGIACLMSENRRAIRWRTVLWGVGLQLAFALLLFNLPRQAFFKAMKAVVQLLTDATLNGAEFVFGSLSTDAGVGAIVAFQVLPVIIFVSALSAVLYHLRVIQLFVWLMAWLMRRTMKTSGAETFGTALLVFLGVESVTAIRAYIREMTRSELATLMTTFMATIAGSVMVVYATMGAEPGHLLTASLMSAPAAIAISKMMTPETGTPATRHKDSILLPVDSDNVIDAAAQGTGEGLQLALNVGAMLIAFLGLVYLVDAALQAFTTPLMNLYGPFAANWGWPYKESLALKDVFAILFYPLAAVMGVPRGDVAELASLLGTKTVLNEFLAYMQLQEIGGAISPRGRTIATYALCGFANPGSLGIIIAGLTGLAPDRRKEIAALGVKAFIGGTLACFTTACIAGMLTYDG